MYTSYGREKNHFCPVVLTLLLLPTCKQVLLFFFSNCWVLVKSQSAEHWTLGLRFLLFLLTSDYFISSCVWCDRASQSGKRKGWGSDSWWVVSYCLIRYWSFIACLVLVNYLLNKLLTLLSFIFGCLRKNITFA